MESPLLLSQRQLAETLGVGIDLVAKLSEAGVIPFILLGERRKYLLDDVLAALRKRGSNQAQGQAEDGAAEDEKEAERTL